ncbi:MAG: Minf_1886 family protein [Candidatus Omnitrophota bacterium]
MTNPILVGILFNTMAKRDVKYNINKIFALLKVLDKDKRYNPESYSFVMSALDYTVKKLEKKGHITGGELLDGLKEYSLEQFGPMARLVLECWGITKTDDFGEIVFNMIDAGILGMTEKDSKKDFECKYDFKEAFDKGCNYTLH